MDVHKSRLETISNYNEGLVYQKSNIEREIINCHNTALPHLDKVISDESARETTV